MTSDPKAQNVNALCQVFLILGSHTALCEIRTETTLLLYKSRLFRAK